MTAILQGKTALVTGASRGIGRGIAQRLAASGALVAINYAANEKAARETLKSIEDKGGKGFLLHAELGTPDSAKALAAALDAELTKRTGDAGLDILVNNVGSGPYGTIETTTPEMYNKTFANNVGATFFVTQAVMPRLRNGGRVINITSPASRSALQQLLVYSMSKGAVDVFTRAMAKELGPRGITVNAVSPGATATDAAGNAVNDPEFIKYMESVTALRRGFAQPEDIADVVHALTTPDMGWVTGQIVDASGGAGI